MLWVHLYGHWPRILHSFFPCAARSLRTTPCAGSEKGNHCPWPLNQDSSTTKQQALVTWLVLTHGWAPTPKAPTHATHSCFQKTSRSGPLCLRTVACCQVADLWETFALGPRLEGLLFTPTSILITLQAACPLPAAFLNGSCFNQACALLAGQNTMCGFTRQDYRRGFSFLYWGLGLVCISSPTQHHQGGFHFLRRMQPTELFRAGKWENGLIKYMLEKKKIRLGGCCLGWGCFAGPQEK